MGMPSGSSITRAKLLIALDSTSQLSSGLVSPPSQVYFTGILVPLTKLLELSLNARPLEELLLLEDELLEDELLLDTTPLDELLDDDELL
ncbi:MAG: hypothetical protein RL497_2142, partial [Pseudomonadota bacterium]